MLRIAECDARVERTANPIKTFFKGTTMHTIVLATQKGGSGKSTLAIGLALAAIQAGHTVRLIETDSQGTLSNWQSRRPYAEPLVEPVYSAGDIESELQSLRRQRRDPDHHRHRRRRQRRDHGGHSLRRSVPDPVAPERRRRRSHRIDARASPAPGTRRSPSSSTRPRSAASASAMPRSCSAMRCRTISPASSHSPTSSCATIIRTRWASAWRSSNTRRQANRPTKSAASGSGSRPG